jgi:acetylornithine deacetylase
MKETIDLLCDMIRFPSVPGQEQDLIQFLAGVFVPLVDELALAPISPELVNDPDYSSPIPGLVYTGRCNLVARIRGTGGGRSLIVNTHADVVPPTEDQDEAFEPRLDGGFIYGRGACDAKGQIAVLWAALRHLKAAGTQPRGDVILHIVVEEENGGNGTLALIRDDRAPADGVVVLEPTNLQIVTAARGAVWFRITCDGHSCHVGSASQSVSALQVAALVMQTLENYRDQLTAASKGVPPFEMFEDPAPLVFGRLCAGSWPATVPGKAVLEGVLGFLPNKTKEQIMAEMRAAVLQSEDPRPHQSCGLEFTFRHDPYVTPAGSPLATLMQKAVTDCGGKAILAAMPASSDAWLYNNRLQIPTIMFGAGELADAHTAHERITLTDLARAADILATFIRLYTG